MAFIPTFTALVSISLYLGKVFAYDNSYYDNVVVYWGQDSYGATHSDSAEFQKPISFYCQDDAIDVLPVSFVNNFFSTGGMPSLNLANTCNPIDNVTFSGTNLANCAALASDIEYCQSQGKLVTLSLGGAGGSVGFTDDTEAETFAQTIWDLFLGGSSSTRPFGNVVLDGVDLDIENGSSTGYAAFVTKIRSLASGANKYYYVTAAPQCVFPDANLGSVINQVAFDAIYVQFYDNQCGLNNYNIVSDWNFGVWDIWAQQTSPNKNVKIYLGAPASSTAAGSGYVAIGDLSSIAVKMRQSFPSFGGVMLWDASQAYVNNRYDLAIKQALSATGSTGFNYPPCSAPAYVSEQTYATGQEVSYGGYIWEAEWWTNAEPSISSGEWNPVGACQGSSPQPSPTATSASSASSPTTTATSASSASSPTTTAKANCSGVSAWQSTAIYTAGNKVTYGGDLWTAKWWSQGDTPGGSTGVWANNGAC